MNDLEKQENIEKIDNKASTKLQHEFDYYVRRRKQIAEAIDKAHKNKRKKQKIEKREEEKNEKIENEIAMALMKEKFQADYDEMSL